MVALVFPSVLALDRSHQFLDFSAVLFALFPLFLTPSFGTWVGERVGSVRARLALRSERLPIRVHLLLVSIPTSIGELVALDVLGRSEEHTSELQSLMRISFAVFCLKKKNTQ